MCPEAFHQKLLAAITRWHMFLPGCRIGVAISGGADSVALTRALHALAEPNRWSIILLHVNHHLRGAESDGDAGFVSDLANGLGLPCRIADLPLAGRGNLEQEARDLRRNWLRFGKMELGLRAVAQGHTSSDQAETVLFRLLRGSGGAGLAAIRPVTPDGAFVRPLLGHTAEETRNYLLEIGQQWREDLSNLSLAFDRNRIRHHLLPQLSREWNPALSETLAFTAEWARAEEDYWETAIQSIAARQIPTEPNAESIVVPAALLTGEPLAVARRLVRHILSRLLGHLRDISFADVERILALAAQPEGSGRLQVPGADILRSFDWVRFGKPGSYSVNRFASVQLTIPGNFSLPGSKSALELQVRDGNCLYNEDVNCLDRDLLVGPLELRTWQPGDEFRQPGRSSRAKLKQMFQDARIPIWERRTWPVVVMNGEVVWSRQFGVAAEFAPGPASSRVVTVCEQPVDEPGTSSQNRNQESGV